MTAPAIEPLFRSGVDHQVAGRLEAASQCYQQVLAIEPQHARSLHLLGTIAFQMGQLEPAAHLIAGAIDTDPDVAAFHNDLGEVYRVMGQIGDAVGEFLRAHDLDPSRGGPLNNLGMLLQKAGKLDEAIDFYRQALSLSPEIPEIGMNLGCALMEKGALDEAQAYLEASRRRAPQDSAASLNLGNLRMRQDRPQEAAELFRDAVQLDPRNAVAEVNLGTALRDLGDPAAAVGHYDRALTLQPDFPAARWNRALSHLLVADFERGWEDFSARWAAGVVPPHGLDQLPEWDGGPLIGKSLLVHAEQGLGDTIQFSRFLPALEALGPTRIVLQCQRPLAALLAPLISTVVVENAELPACDYRIPLLDLPRHLDVTHADRFWAGQPYLSAAPDRLTAWRSRIGDASGKRVGLVWRGRSEHANDRNRSLPVEQLDPLFQLPGIHWFSLQKDYPAPGPAADLAAEFNDMADTAAAIASLDLVIAVDTAVAHLAGALGKPVWIALPFAPDWRWMTERMDSPWYPSARLFRQPQRGDWASVIAAIGSALRA